MASLITGKLDSITKRSKVRKLDYNGIEKSVRIIFRCYGHESARTTKNGVIVEEDVTIEACNTTERTDYMLGSF